MTEAITSPQNRWVKRFRQAIDRHDTEIVVEGPKAVADAIAGGWEAIAVAVREPGEPAFDDPLVFSRDIFKSLSDTTHAQGVLGLFERPGASLHAIVGDASRICVALDGVQDPGNVGTIVRLAAAFDASGVIALEGCADPFGPKAIRASAGAIVHVPVAIARKSELLDAAREAHVPIFATMPDGRAASPPSERAILVLGSEGAGVSWEIASVAEPLTIATSAAVESLNVAMAAAILLARSYESRSFSSASRAKVSSRSTDSSTARERS